MAKADKPLSERQKNILKYISEYIIEHTRPPTIREIGRSVKISSTSVVNYNLTRLVEKGMIERDSEVSRGLRLTQRTLDFLGIGQPITSIGTLRIPFLGAIVAGEPIESFEQNGEETIEIGAALVDNTENLFALRVSGQSMIDAMVDDGDIVILRHQTTARNGDMVAAWITGDDTTTLKYFFHEGDRIRLQPANPTMGPIYIEPERVQVQGKVEMVIRHP
ncbi:MAG TPA: transcriptional repressor LexA [Anaerolineae bacterium]|nr:transcriptional repressor LexA [Anaerolineae bacterium]